MTPAQLALDPWSFSLILHDKIQRLAPGKREEYHGLHYAPTSLARRVREEIRSGVVASSSSGRPRDPGDVEAVVEERLRLAGIFETKNCDRGPAEEEEEEEGGRGGGSGIYPLFSRANHSCTPSAEYACTPHGHGGGGGGGGGGGLVVRALRDIRAGEEISVSYVDPVAPRAERAGKLAFYGFTCDCPLCNSPRSEEHDARRVRLRDIRQLFHIMDCENHQCQARSPFPSPEDGQEALALAKTYLETMPEEDILGSELEEACVERCFL